MLTDLNVHRVVITAVLLAAKFVDDAYYNNAYYAKVGGVMTSEINGLEVDFLFRINFSLNVTSEEFDQYRSELVAHLSTVVTQQLRSSPVLASASQQQAMAAAAAFSAQVAIQQALERQNQVAMYTGDSLMHDDFVQRIASQITPSPAGNSIDGNHQLMSTMLHPNSSTAAEDILAAANSNLLMQSLEFLHQTLDTSNSGNNISGFPGVQRTHLMPVKLHEPSHYQITGGCMNQQNATFANIIPQHSSQVGAQCRQPYSYPMDDQYLRLLVEGSQHHQQDQQMYNNITLQQQVPHTNNLHCHPMIDTAMTQTSDHPYNNMMVLQNEARRLAVAQGQILASAGLSGAVLS